ncbi:MAG: Asp23/Gls24 family envelope stress response protein [Lachnospiraceae bacterium]|nr:Asp23/Gls24 family envelope stress response protein [Lachnospiraceae bacterium]
MTARAGIGRVKIASDVLARIAGIAALDVDGVSAVGAGLNREAVSKVGRNALLKGVKVALDGENAEVDLSVVLGYGFQIPDVCRQVQGKVSASVTNMTGLTVSGVNVRVSGIAMQEED